MSVLIKICGLKTPEALDVALEFAHTAAESRLNLSHSQKCPAPVLAD